jgi:hypothetical protein
LEDLKVNDGRISKFVPQSLLFGIGVIGAVVASPVLAANSLFDGAYSGKATVTYGTAPVCGSDGTASVTVKDGEIVYGFGAFPLKLEVAQDGTFSGRARKGNRGGGQVMRARGTISKSDLEARFILNGVHGRVCAYHWSLSKS